MDCEAHFSMKIDERQPESSASGRHDGWDLPRSSCRRARTGRNAFPFARETETREREREGVRNVIEDPQSLHSSIYFVPNFGGTQSFFTLLQ